MTTTLSTPDTDSDASTLAWLVLRNGDGQHALWPLLRPVPAGWQEVGPEGDRDTALAYVEAQWTDMRPAGLPA